MRTYESIEAIHYVARSIRKERSFKNMPVPTIEFEGTVKLHGTNCGIHITPDYNVITQSRNNVITVQSDSYGFAKFVNERLDKILDLYKKYWDGQDVYIYGELIGVGIQKNVAISKLGRQYVIFDILVNNNYIKNDSKYNIEGSDIYNILRVPTYHIKIDFLFPEQSVKELTDMVLSVENKCPWAAQFGIEGIGEGIVFRSKDYLPPVMFKAKGEKHANKNKTTKNIEVDIEKVASIHALVEQLLPDWRLEQGITEATNNELEMQKLGNYLKWICTDVLKEESERITENGLTWKEVSPHVTAKARNYFINKVNSEV